jgi:N-acetylneuraminic acid mutarotase
MKSYFCLMIALLATTNPGFAQSAAVKVGELPALPTAVSSLGSVACDGYLYVYGGHAGKTHSYDTQTVLGTFHRLKLDGGKAWEVLPGGPILQGMNLATHAGKVYRIGGMQPRNLPGTPTDNISVATCARFDPKLGQWEAIADLPAGRSSHDVAVVGHKLIVIGGWDQKGHSGKAIWHDTALFLDLSEPTAKWQSIPQPFKRRALTMATVGSKVYAIGGLGADGADRRVDILDVVTQQWSSGPVLPGSERVAFSPCAAVVKGRVVVNTSAGPVFRLQEGGTAWEKVGDAHTKRMVARLIPLGEANVILVGGAGGGKNVDAVEVIRLAEKGEPVVQDDK